MKKPSKKARRIAKKYGMPLPPFRHQLKEFQQHRNDYARALLWSMRTGKSRSMIDLGCYNYLEDRIDAVLVIAPNGVHDNWIRRQLKEHLWKGMKVNQLVWRLSDLVSAKAEKKIYSKFEKYLSKDRFFWLAVNSESIINPKTRKLIRRFIKEKRFLLIVDESDDFRTPGSKRTSMIRALKRRAEMRRILTGTLVSNSPLAAYSQFEILEDGALGFSNYKSFENKYAKFRMEKPLDKDGNLRYGPHTRAYPVLVGFKKLKNLRKRISKWASVVLREDCEDLPKLMRTERTVLPTKKQAKIYKKLHKEFVVAVGKHEVSIGENTIRFIKLQQVLSGFIIDEYGDVFDIPGKNPKLEALSREVAQIKGPCIIWAVYHEDIRRIIEKLKLEGRKIGEYHGLIGNKQKQQVIDDFQSGKIDTIVGHPKAGGRGIDLSAAKFIIYYSHTFDAIVRSQSEERGTKAGGHNVAIIDLLVPDSIDTYIRNKVRDKVDISTQLVGKGLKDLLKKIKMNEKLGL